MTSPGAEPKRSWPKPWRMIDILATLKDAERERDEARAEAVRLREALERYESLEGALSTEDIIFLNIQVERRRQRSQWGDEHDAQHTPGEWQALIVERMARPLPALEDDAYRVRLVEIAAMAVAALEARARWAKLHEAEERDG